MKILTDFDGVLTDLTQEAQRVKNLFIEFLVEHQAQDKIDSLIGKATQAMQSLPHFHGWVSQGRITAYSNEDGFIWVNSLAHYFDKAEDPHLEEVRKQFSSKGIPSFLELASRAFHQMVQETAASESSPIDKTAINALSGLVKQGHEVVIVSNSSTDRICQLMNRHSLENAHFRIRGSAKKYELGIQSQGFSVGPYFVETDRPTYRQILEEECPDKILGDVFSLDLALPYTLDKTTTLVLRKRPYTPEWSYDFMKQVSGPKHRCQVIESLEELL